jgi:aminopeptidase N
MFFSLILLIFLSFLPGAAQAGIRAAPSVTHYHLKISFDIPQAKILGTAEIQGAPGRTLLIHTGDLKVRSIKGIRNQPDLSRRQDPLKLVPLRDTVEIVYEGRFTAPEENIISEREIILRNIWYPMVEGLSRFYLTATLPKDYVAISEANHIERTEEDNQVIYTFDFPHPLNDIDGITFAASNLYTVSQGSYRDIEIITYLFPEDAHLAATYLEHAIGYLKLFEDRLGKYPYRRLAIVESLQPGGFSMPTYVLLSQGEIQEITRAEMERTALGHEILHQWFGNSVFTDHNRGNWNEGATIYFADHFYCEQKGSDWRCRRRILSGFASHVTAGKEFPLRLFSERSDFSSRSIGYGKSAMVFHMLRRLMGDERFFAAIKDFVTENTFRVASWDEVQKAMERRSGKNLTWFFRQWLDGTGVPELRVAGVAVKPLGTKFRVSFTLAQTGRVFRLKVPVTFYFSGGSRKEWVTLSRAQEGVAVVLDARPEALVIDEAYDVFRTLTPAEDPPTFERLASQKSLAVFPAAGDDAYGRILDTLTQEGVAVQRVDPLEASKAPHRASLIIFGRDHPLVGSILGPLELPAEGFSIAIRKDPRRPSRLVAVIHSAPGEPVEAALEEVFHYPFYSTYQFRKGEKLSWTLEEVDRGIRINPANPPRR